MLKSVKIQVVDLLTLVDNINVCIFVLLNNTNKQRHENFKFKKRHKSKKPIR